MGITTTPKVARSGGGGSGGGSGGGGSATPFASLVLSPGHLGNTIGKKKKNGLVGDPVMVMTAMTDLEALTHLGNTDTDDDDDDDSGEGGMPGRGFGKKAGGRGRGRGGEGEDDDDGGEEWYDALEQVLSLWGWVLDGGGGGEEKDRDTTICRACRF